MPAWITSELRELVCTPMVGSDSSTITSRPASASARATARPTTPAPITATSTRSTSLMLLVRRRRSFERTHVLRDAGGDADVEAGLRGNPKRGAGGVVSPFGAAVQAHATAARDDLHALGRIGAEMELTGINESDRFFRAVREEQGVG